MGLIVPLLMLAAPVPEPGTPATATATRSAATTTRGTAAPIRRERDEQSLDEMERELKLTGDELARFKEKAEAERVALAEWTAGEGGKQFAALAKARAIAARSKDLDTAKKLWDQMRPLSAERSKLHREKRADILESLSSEPQRRWAGYVLYARVSDDLDRLVLTDQQTAEIRKIADAHAGPAVDPAKLREDPFFRSLSRLRQPVLSEVRQRVLTPQQIEQLRAHRAPKASTTRPTTAAPLEKE